MKNMQIEANGVQVLKMLQLDPEEYKSCLSGWGDSFINMPEKIDFLDIDRITEVCRWLEVEEETTEILCQVSGRVLDNPMLKVYLWHMYYRLKTPSFSSGCSHAGFGDWPLPESALGKYAAAAVALVMLGGVMYARQKYREEKYDEQIIKDTLGVYGATLDRTRKQNGVPAMSLGALNWLRVYMSTRLVELGRFNFKLMEDFTAGTMLENRRNGNKLLLAPNGNKYNSSGYVLQENDPLAEGGWTSEFTETAEDYCGCPVSPEGFVLKKPRCCSKAEWKKILEPGDVLIDMHIPAGGGMTMERCIDSFRKAIDFFTGKYTGKFKPVFICHSWIFNTQFEKKLPESNLAGLMRQCYLFPASSSGLDGMYFLFGKTFHNPAEAPRTTSVQRAFLEIWESGERLRTGGMLLCAEDLNQFGTSYYRRTCEL